LAPLRARAPHVSPLSAAAARCGSLAQPPRSAWSNHHRARDARL